MMKKKEEEDKGKLDDMATKDSVKKDDEKKEEKPDNRGMYAKIAMIKNKLRSAGQRDPMVMAVDACEENKPNQPGSGVKKEIGDKIKTKMKDALPNLKKQIEKNPAGILLQNP